MGHEPFSHLGKAQNRRAFPKWNHVEQRHFFEKPQQCAQFFDCYFLNFCWL